MPPFTITPPYYPIVYVRGFAATAAEREDTFHDTYYGYAATAVEKRAAPPPAFLQPIVFEGQLIRLIKEYGYVDAANGGLRLALQTAHNPRQNPTRSLWISRFYDQDVMAEKVRPIEAHAEELRKLVCEDIPAALRGLDGTVTLGAGDKDYKVILIAHSMGGLVCRCLIQNLLRKGGGDPTRWVHRLVTIGSPHGGIELSAVPDFLEDLVAGQNPFGSAIFKPRRMRQYLNLPPADPTADPDVGTAEPPVHSLDKSFPEGRCLCVVGSDHASYSVVRKATGAFSDGLVRQDRAYIRGAYWANVHRAHSGRRGVVNSFETYENVRRFLFGDLRVKLWLENVRLRIDPPPAKTRDFYDFEFALSVRGTGVMLHRRAQDPCENAQRFEHGADGKLRGDGPDPVTSVHLHTGFLDTKLRPPGETFSRFLLAFRVVQHRVRDGFLFDHEYPARAVYSESMEVRVALDHPDPDERVCYRWLSDTTNPDDPAGWKKPDAAAGGTIRFKFRPADTLDGDLCVHAGAWPDATTETPGIDAARA